MIPSVICGAGAGFTVTVMFKGVPEHPFAVGVTVYTTVPKFGIAVKISFITTPVPACAPVTFICETVHANVVAAMLGNKEILGDSPLQIVEADDPNTSGVGFTVIVTVIGAPGHPLNVGVIV